MKKTSKPKRKGSRKFFKTKADFNLWRAACKKRWRKQNPLKYKAAVLRQKAYQKAYQKRYAKDYHRRRYAKLRGLILFAFLQQFKARPLDDLAGHSRQVSHQGA